MDIEKGEGPELGQTLAVESVPTFVLTNSQGNTVDRWYGYTEPKAFIAILDQAVADPTTPEEKAARFKAAPTAADAVKLARIHSSRDEVAQALEYYLEAQRLDVKGELELAVPVFHAKADVEFTKETVDLDGVTAAADAVFKSKDVPPRDLVLVARSVASLARKAAKPKVMLPYLNPAIEASEGTEDPQLQKSRGPLLVDHALYAEGNAEKAVALQRASLPEGWTDKVSDLNRFVRWCVQSEVNLEEAETLARKSVELAKPGKEKAASLAALAEVRNGRGDPTEAVTLMEQAVKEDPESKRHPKQLARFRELAARQSKP